jgi:hypothetical protein
MTSGLRAILLLALLGGAGILAASEGCSEDPVNTQVGEIGQPCFPGDTCVKGLVCYPFVFDGGGTDGGQCYEPINQPDAADAGRDAADAADVGTDVIDAKTDVQEAASDGPDVGVDAPDGAPDATDARADGD